MINTTALDDYNEHRIIWDLALGNELPLLQRKENGWDILIPGTIAFLRRLIP